MSNELWTQLAGASGVPLGADRVALLDRYLALLLEANTRFNLTRISEPAEAELGHVSDALTLLPYLPREPFALADLGSGGGVPGIPLAIVLPAAKVVLIEATRKKADFLRKCVAELALTNVTVLGDRAEMAGRGERRAGFDIVASRAVAMLEWLVEWSLPLAKVGGSMLAMKGPRVTEELKAGTLVSHRLGGGAPLVHEAHVAGLEHHRIVQIKKIAATPAGYPRDPTIAKGRALG
jgi:16S rRNA (guanine527-N7)-methyltransferase